MTLAKIREDQGNVNEAATVLQELQVRHKNEVRIFVYVGDL